MNVMRKLGLIALLVGVGTALVPTPEAEAGAKGTKAICKTAWAILTPDTDAFQGAVRGIIARNKKLREDGYQEGVIETLELMVFDRKRQPGDVVVAHCGHGGTCNMLAHAVADKFPRLSPVVVCSQDPPWILENGRSM